MRRDRKKDEKKEMKMGRRYHSKNGGKEDKSKA